jgi:protein SCO1
MDPKPKRFPWPLAIGLSLLVLILGFNFFLIRLVSRIDREKSLPVYGQVADFTLTNQNGAVVTLADLEGKIWIADIIFTRCPGPCCRMTRQMKELESALPPDSGVRIVSLTTDPEFDTPEVLKRYAERFDADTNRWMFLTGTKQQIGTLAIEGLKLSAIEKKPDESTIFVLVDRAGQLRGVYHTGGEGVDWAESKAEILSDIQKLERER